VTVRQAKAQQKFLASPGAGCGMGRYLLDIDQFT
jgi:hypothetical protein